jgi:pimeloyl-ACP methyl ester carboxylesterase
MLSFRYCLKPLLLPIAMAATLIAQTAAAQAPAVAQAPVVAAAPVAPEAYTVVNASFACQATTCDAELWLPKAAAGKGKPPVIVMAHGFAGLKDWGLQPFAQRFVQAGFAVVRFDFRGYGKSGGTPRRVVDGNEHVKDWLAAIDAIKVRTDVDGQRLGVWGTSYSGGQVLVAASQRPGVVKAVSAQVPFVSGLQSSLEYPIKYQPVAGWYALRDWMRSDTEEPVYVPVVAKDAFAALICDECVDGYKKVVPPGQEAENKVAARIFMTLPLFTPANVADQVKAPTLVIAAEKDGLIPVEGVRKMVKEIKQIEYVELPGANHFDPYTGPIFEKVVQKQTAFFKQNLMPR